MCIIIAGIVCVYHFVTYTPYGRIDFSSALILRLVNLSGDDRSASDYQPEEFRKMMDDIILRSQGKLVSIDLVEDMKVPWSGREHPRPHLQATSRRTTACYPVFTWRGLCFGLTRDARKFFQKIS